jgi:hypothetical protein
MEEKVVSSLSGVGIYGVISICIFVVFFLAVLAWVIFLKKPYLQTMRSLPLEPGEAAGPARSLSETDSKT